MRVKVSMCSTTAETIVPTMILDHDTLDNMISVAPSHSFSLISREVFLAGETFVVNTGAGRAGCGPTGPLLNDGGPAEI